MDRYDNLRELDLIADLFASVESFRMYRHDMYLTDILRAVRKIRELRRDAKGRVQKDD